MQSVNFRAIIPCGISEDLLRAAKGNKFVSNGHGGQNPVCKILRGNGGEEISVITHPVGADIKLVTPEHDTLHISAKMQNDGSLLVGDPAGVQKNGENIIHSFLDPNFAVKKLLSVLGNIKN